MNDTEAEARRLLAAATEDMPPGIDLLDGFVVARRRDRARRTRRGAVLSAGIAAAAASVAVTLTIGSAPPALAVVTSAMTRTLAQSYHLTEQVGSYYIRNGQIRLPTHYPYTCTSEADPVRHLRASSCSDGEGSREVGRYTYMHQKFDHADHPGWHWWRIPTACLGQVPYINSFTIATPQQMLAEIKKAEKVTVAGPASGPGWTGTRYAFSGGSGGPRLSGTVNVDQQGRVRALALTSGSGSDNNASLMTLVLTFSDFGAPVTVTPRQQIKLSPSISWRTAPGRRGPSGVLEIM
jgi:hypothetical protein